MRPISVIDILQHYRDYIFEEMFYRIKNMPRSPYLEYFFQELGKERSYRVLDLLNEALDGNPEPFYKDQEETSRVRAYDGFKFSDTIEPIRIAKQVIIDFIDKKSNDTILILDAKNDLLKLANIFYEGIIAIAISFLKTREEQINEKVKQLQALQSFTKSILTTLHIEDLAQIILNKIEDFFQVEEAFLAISRRGSLQLFSRDLSRKTKLAGTGTIKKTIAERSSFFVDITGRRYKTLNDSLRLRFVSVPLNAYGKLYGALAFRNRKSDIKLSEKDLELLYQFIDIMSISLENAYMFQQIEESNMQSRLLAKNIIIVQERERKRLAADIHDTLAQSLTGINYKIQYCKELFKYDTDKLLDQLDCAIKMSNNAIDQSRALISSLRPNLIDIMGLIPALKHYFQSFEQETGIKVNCRCPSRIRLPSDLMMCIFRVTQEAMTNVHKHAEACSIDFSLQKKDRNIDISIQDDGKGFKGGSNKLNAMGLLLMKERVESFGGTIKVSSELNKGCRIKASIPYPKRGSK